MDAPAMNNLANALLGQGGMRDHRANIRKTLEVYDGARDIVRLERWINANQEYLRTMIPLPGPALDATGVPVQHGIDDIPRDSMLAHLAVMLTGAALEYHIIIERTVDDTGAFTVDNWTRYKEVFIPRFYPTNVRNRVEMELDRLKLDTGMNQLIDDFTKLRNQMAAAVRLRETERDFTQHELIDKWKNAIRRGRHSGIAQAVVNYIAQRRDSNINRLMEFTAHYWDAEGQIDRQSVVPYERLTRPVVAARRVQQASGNTYCYTCGVPGHRSNQCPQRARPRFAPYQQPRQYQGNYPRQPGFYQPSPYVPQRGRGSYGAPVRGRGGPFRGIGQRGRGGRGRGRGGYAGAANAAPRAYGQNQQPASGANRQPYASYGQNVPYINQMEVDDIPTGSGIYELPDEYNSENWVNPEAVNNDYATSNQPSQQEQAQDPNYQDFQ
jgi:hypothetical protein